MTKRQQPPPAHVATIEYTNRHGVQAEVRIVPYRIAWTGSEWVLTAVDLELGHLRHFSLERLNRFKTTEALVPEIDTEVAGEVA